MNLVGAELRGGALRFAGVDVLRATAVRVGRGRARRRRR